MSAPVPSAQRLTDGIGPLFAGVNSGVAPTLLPGNQGAFSVNVTYRGGYARTRPPWLKFTLSYPDEDTREFFTTGLFQGAAFYSSFGTNPSCLIASIGGRIFRLVVTGRIGKVQDITPLKDDLSADVNDPTLMQAWLSQGQDFMLISDGQSANIVYDGAGTRRLDAPYDLPTCRQSHYCNGRFIVAIPPNGGGPARGYIASDLVYNTDSGTPQYNYRDAILHIKDNLQILGGAQFAPPLNAGPITALFSVAIPDTSLGQGPLQVSTLGGIFSVNLPLDATLWTTTQQPTQVVSLPNGGVTGQYAVCTVNGDAWYRSPEGFRSFITARRDFNTWVQTPLSTELARVLPFDTTSLLGHASVVDFNNRFIATCSPYDTRGRGIAHRGLVALDFNNVSSLTLRSQPCWEGLWTGQPVLQLVTGTVNSTPRCFAFCLDGDGLTCLYEIGPDYSAYFDNTTVTDVATECWLESGTLLGREGDLRKRTFKRLLEGQLWLNQLAGAGEGTLPMSASYISDQLPCWRTWSTWSLCAPLCATQTTCEQETPTHPQYATYLRLPQPSDDCNQLTLHPYRTAYSFQVRLGWVGHLELREMAVFASPQPEPQPAPLCSGSTVRCTLLQCCPTDLFTYAIESHGAVPPNPGALEWDDGDQPGGNDAPTWDEDEQSTITPIL